MNARDRFQAAIKDVEVEGGGNSVQGVALNLGADGVLTHVDPSTSQEQPQTPTCAASISSLKRGFRRPSATWMSKDSATPLGCIGNRQMTPV